MSNSFVLSFSILYAAVLALLCAVLIWIKHRRDLEDIEKKEQLEFEKMKEQEGG